MGMFSEKSVIVKKATSLRIKNLLENFTTDMEIKSQINMCCKLFQ